MKLVSDASEAWKWGSTRMLVVIAALQPTWDALPDDVKAMVPEWALPWVFPVLAIAGLILRLTDWSGERT